MRKDPPRKARRIAAFRKKKAKFVLFQATTTNEGKKGIEKNSHFNLSSGLDGIAEWVPTVRHRKRREQGGGGKNVTVLSGRRTTWYFPKCLGGFAYKKSERFRSGRKMRESESMGKELHFKMRGSRSLDPLHRGISDGGPAAEAGNGPEKMSGGSGKKRHHLGRGKGNCGAASGNRGEEQPSGETGLSGRSLIL